MRQLIAIAILKPSRQLPLQKAAILVVMMILVVVSGCNLFKPDPLVLADRLTTAIKFKDVGQVKRLINSGADVNGRDGSYLTPLQVAVRDWNLDQLDKSDQDLEILRFLVERGADVSVTDPKGDTPLNNLLFYWQNEPEDVRLKAVQLLVKHGADVNVRHSEGSSPLELAGGSQIFEFLRQHGAVDAVANRQHYRIRLLRAAQDRDYDQIKALVNQGVELPDLILLDVIGGMGAALDLEIVTFLLDRGAKVNLVATLNGTSSALHTIISREDYLGVGHSLTLMKLLISRGADINARSQNLGTPLSYARAIKAHPELIDFLQQQGAQE